MYALLLGVLFISLKLFEIGPVAEWAWWWVLSPLPVAVVWWAWADASGYTKRKEMEKMDRRKRERIARQTQALRGVKLRR